MNNLDTRSEVDELKDEHASLEHEIADWRTWWDELSQMGQPHFGEMAARLERFRDHLAAHFVHEEQIGLLPAVSQLPKETVDTVARLQDEHRPMLAKLNQLIVRLRACGPEIGCWGQARQEFEEFLDQLHQHEEAESRLQR